MNDINKRIISAFLFIVSGILIAFLANLLVYFKQKEILHLLIIIVLTFAIFYAAYLLLPKLRLPTHWKIIGVSSILLISWLGPQLIYQVRPYTFYISGLVMAMIAITALSTGTVDEPKTLNLPLKLALFIGVFTIAYFIPWKYVQYTTMGLSTALAGIYILKHRSSISISLSILVVITVVMYWQFATPLRHFREQVSYEDKVLFSADTQFHKIVVTQWQDDYWVFKDKLKDISSIDDFLFYEPMVHSIFRIHEEIRDVLVVGGENGCLIKEVLKYPGIKSLDVISYDTLLRDIGKSNVFFTKMNEGAFGHQKTNTIRKDMISYLSETDQRYDAILIDLPDPRSIETNQYYTREFYQMIARTLHDDGIMITQAGSPYFATAAFVSIGKTIQKAGFYVLPLHNQILTLGEWGWYIGSTSLRGEVMKERLGTDPREQVETEWFNNEAAKMISSFGKMTDIADVPGINTLDSPLVYQYYLKGNWSLN